MSKRDLQARDKMAYLRFKASQPIKPFSLTAKYILENTTIKPAGTIILPELRNIYRDIHKYSIPAYKISLWQRIVAYIKSLFK